VKNYDLIVIGTGSAMNYINPIIDSNPEMKIAVIDKDEPGGICLTRGAFLQKFCFTLRNLSGNWEWHRFLE
jgi:mycothione reductase